jgi:hypothetical protein
MDVRRTAGVLAGVVLAVLVGGCSATTGGSGTARLGSVARTPDFPSGTPAPSGTAPFGTGTGTAPSGTAPSGSTPSGSTPSDPGGPTLQQRDGRLTAQTNGQPHVAVGVPGGLEAAVWGSGDAIGFWRSAGASPDWTQVGSSSYPQLVAGAPGVAVNGTLLTGMTHATFIVTGQFTTDGSGQAVAFTTGPKGWGAIKAEPDGNIGPSGAPVGADRIGLARGFAFADGELVTADCPQNRPIAGCGGHEVLKRWTWTGTDFRRAP